MEQPRLNGHSLNEHVKKALMDSVTLAMKIPRGEIDPVDYYHRQMWILFQLEAALTIPKEEDRQLSLKF